MWHISYIELTKAFSIPFVTSALFFFVNGLPVKQNVFKALRFNIDCKISSVVFVSMQTLSRKIYILNSNYIFHTVLWVADRENNSMFQNSIIIMWKLYHLFTILCVWVFWFFFLSWNILNNFGMQFSFYYSFWQIYENLLRFSFV